MKIGKKLMITVVLVAILSSIGGIVGLTLMNNMNANYHTSMVEYGFSQGDIGLFNTEFNNNRAIVSNIILSTDTDTLNANIEELNESDAKITTYFTNVKKGIVTDKELSYYNDIKDNLAKFAEIRKHVVTLTTQNNNSQAYTLLLEQVVPMSNLIRSSTESLISLKTKTGNEIAANLISQTATATIFIIVVLLVCLIISILIALRISHSISNPVKEMVIAAKSMAAGNLDAKINVTSRNEMGQLAAAFTETIETMRSYITDISKNLSKVAHGDLNIQNDVEFKGDFVELKDSIDNIVIFLNDTLTQINQAGEQVSNGSTQVSNGAQALAQGATEQASSIEELSALIMEISAQVKQNAEHAANASLHVDHVGTEIETSNKHMAEMVLAMSQINDSSSQIGKIIKVIEDIAFQTNILALNAAVEAARAGSAGKGFAVVADEVRNLASKSAEAAKDTTALIQNSMDQVKRGTKIADETAKSLLNVVDSAKIVTDTVVKISEASIRQSDAVGQITLGVDQISNVVQTNSATAEESAAASEELSAQAQMLRDLVDKFKLKAPASNAVPVQSASSEEPQSESEADTIPVELKY